MSRDGRTLGVLISGRGTNLQAIIDAIQEGRLDARIGVVVSNKAKVEGLERAQKTGIATSVIEHKAFPSREPLMSVCWKSCASTKWMSCAWPASCGFFLRCWSVRFPVAC